MTWPDMVNGGFELGAAVMNWINVRTIYRDKQVRGVDWRTYLFFAGWGWWNLYFYPSLGQWVSAIAGFVLVLANTTWVVLAWRFTRETD